tara:strand:+ start:388 stop:1494 length:1107 start_codon:yes stop_codon:yes gene_type:complete
MGYSVLYDQNNYSTEENLILKKLIDQFNIELSHIYTEESNKFHVKIRRNCYPRIMDYLRITDFKPFKIQEGNGSPGGVYRGSGGYKIEPKVRDQLNEALKAKHKCKLYEKIVSQLPKTKRKMIQCFLKKEKENCRRPMFIQNGCIDFKNNTCKNISDIDIFFHDTHNSAGILFISSEYISQKSSGLVTFINAGIQKDCLIENEIKACNIQSEKGLILLRTLGINPFWFSEVFNNYFYYDQTGDDKYILKIQKIAEIANESISFKNNNYNHSFYKGLEDLIKKSMGNGDSIISHIINGHEIVYKNKQKNLDLISYKSYYGRKKGKSKGIDIEVITDKIVFTFNIRNKSGGIYPSHLMCDFKYHNDPKLF